MTKIVFVKLKDLIGIYLPLKAKSLLPLHNFNSMLFLSVLLLKI